ncbi:unnamed protein product [Cutaneotrichosporon oleaginosum]
MSIDHGKESWQMGAGEASRGAPIVCGKTPKPKPTGLSECLVSCAACSASLMNKTAAARQPWRAWDVIWEMKKENGDIRVGVALSSALWSSGPASRTSCGSSADKRAPAEPLRHGAPRQGGGEHRTMASARAADALRDCRLAYAYIYI